jgi:hypothetical protein
MLLSVEARNSSQAVAALKWIWFSKRPLLLTELAEVLFVDLTADPILDLEDLEDRIPGDEVLKLLPGIIELSSSEKHPAVVTFARSSIKDYLVSRVGVKTISVGRTTVEISERIAHDSIAELCLSYLLHVLNVPKEWGDLVTAFPLLPYATMYTFGHIQSSQCCSDSVLASAIEFSNHYSQLWTVWSKHVRINRYGDLMMDHENPDNALPIYVLAFLDLT